MSRAGEDFVDFRMSELVFEHGWKKEAVLSSQCSGTRNQHINTEHLMFQRVISRNDFIVCAAAVCESGSGKISPDK